MSSATAPHPRRSDNAGPATIPRATAGRPLAWLLRETLVEIGDLLDDQRLVHLVIGRDRYDPDRLLVDGEHLLQRQFGPLPILRWSAFATGYGTGGPLPAPAGIRGVVAMVEEHWLCRETLSRLTAWVADDTERCALVIELVDPRLATVCRQVEP